MSDRAYFILRNRIANRLEKPRNLISHIALFTAYTVIFGTMSMVVRGQGMMDGIFYWSIFGWSVLVGMHTIHAYLRSGAWAATRDRLINEEILEAADEFDLSSEEMIDLHERLAESIQQDKNSRIFNQLAAVGGGNFGIWNVSLVLLFILQRLLVGFNPPEENSFLNLVFSVWQPLSVFATLCLSATLVPWQSLIPRSKSRTDLSELYHSKGKREMLDHFISSDEIDDEGEILPQYEEKYRQNSLKNR